MTSSRPFRAAICVLLCAFTFHAAAETPELRQAWREALQSIRETGAELPDTRSLRRYALYPYLESAALIEGLRNPAQFGERIAAATSFLEHHDTTAIADAFRRELLFTLSELGAWSEFIRFYRAEVANESRECEYLRARVTLGLTDDLAPLVEERWLTPRRLDSACEPAFQWLRQTGNLDPELTAQRIELLLEAGQTDFARVIAARLPDESAEVYRQWAAMLDAPLDALDAVAEGSIVPLHTDALPAVWSRASVRAPAETLERLPDVIAIVVNDSSDEIPRMRRELALGLSWDRRVEALEVFAQLNPDDHDDYSLGWLTRSALWNDEWELADRALESMSSESRAASDWSYWRARVAALLGRTDEARSLYTAVLDRDNFYSAMAAARLGRQILPNNQPASVSQSLTAELSEQDGFVRSRELFLLGERIAATREWQYATRNLSKDELTAAMLLAASWGWHDITVATATRAEVFFDYRHLYPLPWSEEIASAATEADVEPTLLRALIRQESMFRPDAVSSAGAIGLTQLGLATARVAAQALGQTQPTRTDLFDPARNTSLGAITLNRGMQQFSQQVPVALAAYNAGPAAAQRWLPEESVDSDIWIENIPYNETREYVRRVLWNEIVYRWLRSDGAAVDPDLIPEEIAAAPASTE